MNVLPKIGTESIRFGATEAEAIALLGNPDKTYLTDEGCKRLQFNSLRLELSFEPENENRLGWIEIHDPDSSLGGRNLIGASQDEALAFVTEFLGGDPEIEDFGSFLSASYEGHWVELQCQFGILDCINLGVPFDESDQPIWPSAS